MKIFKLNTCFTTFLLFFIQCFPAFEAKAKNHSSYIKYSYETPQDKRPSDMQSSAQHVFNSLKFTTLFKINDFGQPQPNLIRSYEIDFQHNLMRLSLRQSQFHDGTLIKPKDVVRALNYLIIDSANQTAFRGIKRVYIKNGAVEILGAPGSQLATLLSSPLTGIWKLSGKKIVGSGPYSPTSNQSPHSGYIFKRFPEYFDKSMYYLPSITIIKTDAETALKRLADGEGHDAIDFDITPPNLPYYLSNKKLNILQKPLMATWLFTLNSKRGAFKNLKHRLCFISSFPKKDYIKQFLSRHQVTETYIPQSMILDKMPASKIDADSCKNLSTLEIKIDYPQEVPDAREQCHFLARHISKYFKAICNIISFNKLMENIKHFKTDLSLLAMAPEVPDIRYMLTPFLQSSDFRLGGSQDSSLQPRIKNLFDIRDRNLLIKKSKSIERYILHNAYILPLSQPNYTAVISSCVTGLKLHPYGPSHISYEGVELRGCNQYE